MSLINEIETHKKKTFFKKVLIFILLVVIGGSIYYSYSKTQSVPETVSEKKIFTVAAGNIKTSIEADGRVLLKDEFHVDFVNDGIIAKINTEVGQQIKKGDMIASLDTKYLDLAIEKAKVSLQIAESNYDIKSRGASDTELQISEKQLEKDKVSYDNSLSEIDLLAEEVNYNLLVATQNLENVKKQNQVDELGAKNNLDTAQLDYDNAISNLDLISKQEEEKYKNMSNKVIMEVGQIITLLEKYLYDTDVLLGVSKENRDLNDRYESLLGAKNTNLRTTGENNLQEILGTFITFYEEWSTFRKSVSSEDMLDYEKLLDYSYQLRDIASRTNKLLDTTIEILKNSIPSSDSLSQTTIDSQITSFETALSSLKNEASSFVNTIQVLAETYTASNFKVDTQEKLIGTLSGKIVLASANYDKILLQNTIALDTANQKIDALNRDVNAIQTRKENTSLLQKSQVGISQASLDNKKEVSKIDLEPYYLAILSAKASLDEANKKKEDSKLLAPIDGKIVAINAKEGESTNALKDTFATIINEHTFYIDAYVEEADVTKVKIGQNVNIAFEAIDGLTLTGSVNYVNDIATIDTNGFVSYRVEIVFVNSDPRIKDAMSVGIDFITKEVKNVLTIPVQAVKTLNNKPGVILENGESRSVVTGFTDSKMVEIISGLSKGEKILYY